MSVVCEYLLTSLFIYLSMCFQSVYVLAAAWCGGWILAGIDVVGSWLVSPLLSITSSGTPAGLHLNNSSWHMRHCTFYIKTWLNGKVSPIQWSHSLQTAEMTLTEDRHWSGYNWGSMSSAVSTHTSQCNPISGDGADPRHSSSPFYAAGSSSSPRQLRPRLWWR